MINTVSQKFLDIVKGDGRTFRAKIVINDKEYTEFRELKLTKSCESGDSLSFGSCFSSSLTATIPHFPKNSAIARGIITLYVGLKIGTSLDSFDDLSKYEWVKLGIFNISESKFNDDELIINAYDNFYLCEKLFTSNLSGMQKIKTIVNEQCVKVGITYIDDIEDVSYNVDTLKGLTIREAFSYLASYLGKNAIFNEDGKLQFIWYNKINKKISADRFSSPLTIGEYDTVINSITCITKEIVTDENGNIETKDKSITVGSGEGIIFSNPYMTEVRMNALLNKIKGFTFRSCEMNWIVAEPHIQVGDIVSVEDTDTTYIVPIMNIEMNLDGGCSATVKSKYKVEEADRFEGSLSKKVERNYQEYASFKEVIAEKVTAFEGDFTKVNTDILNVNKELIAIKGNIKDLNVDELVTRVATIETSYVNKQYVNENYVGIQYANTTYAVKSEVKDLTADVAKINTLLSGSVTAGSTQTIVLNAENTTIANALIKDAMIDTLNFNKIIGIDINTTKLNVHSNDGLSTWKDNTILIKDSKRTRVQIGKDAQGDYNIYIWDKDGKVMFDPLGLTADGVNREVIDNSNVKPNAGIKGSKLDIDSVITEVNGATTTIKSSRIYFDEKKQTLDVAFNTMSNTVTETTKVVETANTNANNALSKANNAITDSASAKTTANSAKSVADGAKTTADSANTKATTASTNASNALAKANQLETKVTTVEETVKTQSTQITTAQGQISTIITDVTQAKKDIAATKGDVTTAKANITTLSNNYSSIKQTVEGLNTTVGSHTSQLTTIKGTADSAKTLADSKAKIFTATPTTPYKVGDLWAQGASGVIMRCKTARASGAYVASDWEKADKYTDDTTANKVRTDLTATIKTVTDKQATFETTLNGITSRVSSTETKVTTLTTTANNALSNANNAKAYTDAVKNNFGYLYKTSIVINGESNKYYPVVLRGGNQNVMRELFIVRGFSEQAPNDWNTSTHKGGLTLKIKCNYGGWGGIDYSWYIHDFEQSYASTFGGKAGNISGMFFYIFLRGGGTTGAKYYIYSDQPLVNEYMGGSSPQICYNSDQVGYSVGNGTVQSPQYRFNAPSPIATQDTETIKKKKYASLAETNYTELTSTKSTVATHTTQLNNITSRVSTTETNITTINGNITNLTTRMSSAEQKVTDSAIVATVTKSSSWSTLNTKATDAQTKANNLVDLTTIKDTRSANNNPQWYFTNYPKKTVKEFKACTVVGITGESTYGTLVTEVPWTDSSGGYPTQLFYPNNSQNVYRRIGTSTTAWGAWTKVAGTHNAISIINQTAESIKIQASKISLEGLVTANSRFKILTDGSMEAVNGKFSGSVTATSGKIGKFNITSTHLNTGSGTTSAGMGGNQAFWAGSESSDNAPFRVAYDGTLIASKATITGNITGGSITGNTTINVGTDLTVGNNIYINQSVNTTKKIIFNNGNQIWNTWSGSINYISVRSDYRASLTADNGNYVAVTGSKYSDGGSVQISASKININGTINCSTGLYSRYFNLEDHEWIGLYNGSGTRKGWVGHNETNALYIWNENGGDVNLVIGTDRVILQPASGTYSGYFMPKSDGRLTLGTTAHRWYRLYQSYASVSTSDRREKRLFNKFDERYEKMFVNLKPQTYEFIKENGDVRHSGFIAQDVQETMHMCNIRDNEFAGLQFEKENDYYGLAYEEFIALNTHMIQKNITKLSQHDIEIQELRNENAKLKQELVNTQAKLNAFISGNFEFKTVTREVV